MCAEIYTDKRGDKMKAFTDKIRCIGCGICASLCPAVFAIGPDGKAITVITDVPEGSMDNAVKAGKLCPSSAVLLEY